jgi:hypothetical protein
MAALGVLFFLCIAGLAFWMLLFLLGFVVPFWITLGLMEAIRPKRFFEDEN